MTPVFASERLDWSSAIGLFIINFGMLDLLVQDCLENNLPAEQFAKFKDRHFRDRVERIRQHVGNAKFSPEERDEFEKWVARLEPLRELRNDIAHCVMRTALAEDQKTLIVTLSLPRDFDGTNSPAARHLTFEQLVKALTDLTKLIEDLQKWVGNWVVDADIKF